MGFKARSTQAPVKERRRKRNEFVNSREFIRGAARFHDLVGILSRDKGLLEEGIAHTSAIGIDRGNWCDVENTAWDSTAIAAAKQPSEKLVFIGEEGDVIAYVGGKSTQERIKPAPTLIRNAATIDGFVYACGMLRQVYRRSAEKRWDNVSAPKPKGDEEVGFEAIDGYAEDDLYACGWSGEIWHYNGSKWASRSTGVDKILTSVCCAGDGSVYVGGQDGVLLKGRGDAWKRVKWKTRTDDDFWDVCWFNDKLYIATMTGLFTLDANTLAEVDFGNVEASTFYSLTHAEGVMWSVGQEDVLSFDGKNWQRYA